MAAIPKNVRSRTVRTLFNPCACASPVPFSASDRIESIVLRRNNELAISVGFKVQNREKIESHDSHQDFQCLSGFELTQIRRPTNRPHKRKDYAVRNLCKIIDM